MEQTQMKPPLLYLCHRIPFPPNKGDKITTFHVLKFLSQHYEVYLGTFVDDQQDWQYRDYVQSFCKEALFVPLNEKVAKLKGASAFITGAPITLPFYYSGKMQRWVHRVVKDNGIEKMFIYSACMAQYVLSAKMQHIHKIMQFADIDSDKWRQFAQSQSTLMRLVYLREFEKLFDYEQRVTEQFNLSCFISDAEVKLFKSMVKAQLHPKIKTLSNGIDSDFFSPTAKSQLAENYPLATENYVVFTGAMDYQPNVDSVVWFVHQVWLKVCKKAPNSRFYIVGSAPSKKVLDLMQFPGVVVTGRVEDVRPYLQHAKAAVAPMQMARGIQNKILEAMAMELPVMTTLLGAEGIELRNDNLFITDSADRMREWVSEKLKAPARSATESRRWLQANYSWEAKLSPMLEYLGEQRA